MPHVEVMPEEDAESTSLTLTDMARQLQLAESTTRYYCKRFASFIPVVGEGRRRRYGPEALEVMGVIAEYMTSMRSATAVAEALEKRFPRVVDAAPVVTPLQADAPAMPAGVTPATYAIPAHYLEQQTKAMQVMALTLDKVTRQQEALRRLAAASKAIVEENRALKQELASVRELLHTAELVHQEDLQQIRNWMGKIIRRGATSAAPRAETAPAVAAPEDTTPDTAAADNAPLGEPLPETAPAPETAPHEAAGEALPETAPAMFAPDATTQDTAELAADITYITEDTSIYEEELAEAASVESLDAATAEAHSATSDATQNAATALELEADAAAPTPEATLPEAAHPAMDAAESAESVVSEATAPTTAIAEDAAPETMTPEAAAPEDTTAHGGATSEAPLETAAPVEGDAPEAVSRILTAPSDDADMAGLSWRAPLPQSGGQ